ncbi:MAG: type II CAAX endopeptidase family protein [Clostridia bacterium]|nr:type II CAAX endopeptidase family protein [Clostridia bacterium]
MYNNTNLTKNFYTPQLSQKALIKRDMSKISSGLMLVYLIITVVSSVFSVFNLDSFLDLTSGSGTLMLYVLNGIALTISLPIGAYYICHTSGTSLSDVIITKRIGFKKTALYVFAGLGVCMFANFLVEFLSIIGIVFGVDIASGTPQDFYYGNSPVYFFLTLLSISIVPAFVEEFIFRGAILGVLRKHGDGFAIIMSSILFGLLHGNFVQTPFAFLVGLALAYLTVCSGSMIPAMIVHFVNNAISVVFSVFEANSNEILFSALYMIICSLLIIWGIMSYFSLSKSNRDMLKFDNEKTQNLSFSKRIQYAITEPWTIVFSVIMIGSCILLLVSGFFV